jgi:hypothetical protein
VTTPRRPGRKPGTSARWQLREDPHRWDDRGLRALASGVALSRDEVALRAGVPRPVAYHVLARLRREGRLMSTGEASATLWYLREEEP